MKQKKAELDALTPAQEFTFSYQGPQLREVRITTPKCVFQTTEASFKAIENPSPACEEKVRQLNKIADENSASRLPNARIMAGLLFGLGLDLASAESICADAEIADQVSTTVGIARQVKQNAENKRASERPPAQ